MSGNGDDWSAEARRERWERSRRRSRNRRRLLLGAVPATLALIGAGWFLGLRESDPATGTTAADKRAERARELARRHAREDRAIDRVRRYTTFIRAGAGRGRQVALTFDDGPGPDTRKILRILRRTRTPATFFVVGSVIPGNEEILRQIVREGHAIGNHTQNHPSMGELDLATQREELEAQDEAITGAGVRQRKIFRPPYRSYNRSTFDLLAERGELMVLWSIDTDDYANPGAKKIARKVLSEIRPGSIVLMHDAGGDRSQTVQALPDIIRGLKKRRLRPVTVPQLIAKDPPARGERYPEGI